MTLLHRIPKWMWAIIVLLLLAIGVFVGVAFLKPSRPNIPPALVEERKALAELLKKSADVEDVDIRPLPDLEAKKNYGGAVALMERALAANETQRAIAFSLNGAADELARLSVHVKPDDAGEKAVATFVLLKKFAGASQIYYEDRKRLYEMTRDYYADLAAKKNPPIPENLRDVVNTVTSDLATLKELDRQFASALTEFDSLVASN